MTLYSHNPISELEQRVSLIETVNERLLDFREFDTLNELCSVYDVLEGDDWKNIRYLTGEFRRNGYHTQRNLHGLFFPDYQAIWINNRQSSSQKNVTLIHEFLHAYCHEFDIDEDLYIPHKHIEEEAIIICNELPEIPMYIKSLYQIRW